MSIRQLNELKRCYVPNSREFGRRAFARRFGCSIGQIDYWLSSDEQIDRRRKWRRLKQQSEAPNNSLTGIATPYSPAAREALSLPLEPRTANDGNYT